MKRNTLPAVAFTSLALLIALAAAKPTHAYAQDAKASSATMAPIDQYLMEQNAEIALARSAAPESISKDADVWVLEKTGYKKAVTGSNGFVCIVHRSWTSEPDDREFWNPDRRGPICFNAAAARSYLPNTILRTNLVLAGKSKEEMFKGLEDAFDKNEFPPIEPGAMCYMLAKQGHLSDRDGHWHPHLMFFVPLTKGAAWGAGLPGSPILADEDAADHMTVFLVPVSTWSDGTSDSMHEN